jgi:hypothetical protein
MALKLPPPLTPCSCIQIRRKDSYAVLELCTIPNIPYAALKGLFDEPHPSSVDTSDAQKDVPKVHKRARGKVEVEG